MFKALYKKELKAIWGWIPVIIIINLFLLYKFTVIGYFNGSIAEFILNFGFIGINYCIAIIIGFTQTELEHIRNTHQFLMFRPAAPSKIFIAKLAAGLTVITFSLLIVFFRLLYIVNHPEIIPIPWRISMCNHIFLAYAFICFFYLGAFLTGIDNRSRWFGMKTAGVIFSACICYNMEYFKFFSTAYILYIFGVIIILIRIHQLFNSQRLTSPIKLLPSVIISIFVWAFIILFLISNNIIGHKYSKNLVYIDNKNNVVINNYRQNNSSISSIYYNEKTEFLKNFNNDKILAEFSFPDPYNLTFIDKESLNNQSKKYYSNEISKRNKDNRILWYYIYDDKIFEIYIINKIKEDNTESRLIGYFGKNGLCNDKTAAVPFHNDNKNLEVTILKNNNDTSVENYYLYTSSALYSIYPDSYSVKLINDLSKFVKKYTTLFKRKIFSGKNYILDLGYSISVDDDSNIITAVNVIDTTNIYELKLPQIKNEIVKLTFQLNSDDTFYLIARENPDIYTNIFYIYKTNKDKTLSYIKKIEKPNIVYWKTQYQLFIYGQSGLMLFNYFFGKLDESIIPTNELQHPKYGLFQEKIILSSIIGIILFIIIFFGSMRKDNLKGSFIILWFITAFLFPFLFTFVYFSREKNN